MTTLVNRVIFKSNKNNGLGTSIDIQGNIDISGNIIPSSNSFDLGSNTQQWRDMHFSGNLYQNGLSYTGSQWTTSGTKLFYNTGNVGIGTNNPIYTLDVSGNSRISGNIAVGGNLSVSGTLTTIDSTTVTVQDPVITLSQGVLNSNDNKDRGVEFLYYDGSSKRGFFGFDNTSSNFIYLINATNSSEVLTGTYGNIQGGAFISSNTSGAPLTVTSSGLVTNLNADLLDGQHGTYYLNWSNFSGIPNLVNSFNSRTGNVTLTATDISNATSSLNLYFNSSNIGIGSSIPSKALDVSGNIAASGNISAGNFVSCANINFTGNLYQNSSLYIGSQWTTSGNTIFYNTGNIGVGSSIPRFKLDVSGNIYASNTITSNNTITGTQIISNITNGTSPLTVTSSTLVTNLNADLLDGINSTQFMRTDTNTSTTGTITGTQLISNSTITGTQLISNIANGTAPLTVTSSTLVTNLNTNLLEGLNPSQFMRTDISTSTIGNISGANISSSGTIISSSTITGTQLISNIANGTAPLTVTSSTLVTNLNADLLGGLNSSQFMRTDSNIITTGSIISSNTITGTQMISNIATGTAPLTVSSTTLVNNLNVDMLNSQNSAYYLNYNNLINKPSVSGAQWTGGNSNKIYYNSGNVGIGSSDPSATLDVQGDIKATFFSENWMPLVKKMFVMSGGTACYVDVTAGNTGAKGFYGGFTDGRYVYLVPRSDGTGFTGIFTRVDINNYTTTGVTYLNVSTNNTLAAGFTSGFTDGRYAYLVPGQNNTNVHGILTRVDLNNFTTSGVSYLDVSTAGNTGAKGFMGGFTDGRYVYLVPNQNPTNNGILTRVDLNNYTTSGIAYLDVSTAGNTGATGFFGGFTDGKYVYLVPYRSTVYNGILTRIAINNFTTSGVSYLDVSTAGNTNARGFWFGFTAGRYAYLVPSQNEINYIGILTRVDRDNFTTSGVSYLDVSTAGNTSAKGFRGGFTDGRYGYLVPYYNGVHIGIFTRIDFTNFTTSGVSYLDVSTAGNTLAKGFHGGFTDGQYAYLVPYDRIDATLGQVRHGLLTRVLIANVFPQGF